jgi:hypothetical protein
MDLFDGHLMNCGFGFGQPLKHAPRPFPSGCRQCRCINQRENLRQAAMRSMTVLARVVTVLMGSLTVLVRIMTVLVIMTVRMLVNRELRRRDAGAQHFFRVDMGVAEREASEGAAQGVQRKAGVQKRTKGHIARDSRKAIEVRHAAHNCPISFRLQNR